MTSDQVLELRKLLVQDELKRQKEIEGLAKRVETLEKDLLALAYLLGQTKVKAMLSTDLSTGIGQKRE